MSETRRYWYPGADGEAAGPLPAEEIRQRLRGGLLRPSSPLCVEGSSEWQPASAFPELAEAAAAAPPREATPAQTKAAAAPKPAPGARPSPLKPVPYTAGAKPATPGPYLAYSHPVAEIAGLMDALTVYDQPPPPLPRARWGPRLLLSGALVALAILAAVVDMRLGFPRSPFAFLIPFAALTILLVIGGTGASRPRPGWMAYKQTVGCVFGLFGLPMAWVLSTYALGFPVTRAPWAWLQGAALLLILWALLDNRATPPTPPQFDLSRMAPCKAILEALEHDAMPGKTAAGWLDLTGSRQGSKVCREGNAASGRHIRLYRDEWWRLTLPLRDGNRLRISVVERVKVKDAVRRRRRTKPEVEESVGTLEVKLGVNTAAFRTGPAFTPATIGPSLTPGPIETTPDSVATVARIRGVTQLRSGDVLALLALVYARLERLKPEGGPTP